MDDDAELVESGSFRVDRARALEKLKEFQFSDPALFILAFARCAVAAGASSIEVASEDSGFIIRFDGKLFSHQRLNAPFEALFAEEGDRSEADRHLALGILGALRTTPTTLTVESGPAENRIHLALESVEKFGVTRKKSNESKTRINLQWGKNWIGGPRAIPVLQEGCAMLPIPLSIDGAPVNRLPDSEKVPVHEFTAGSVRGFLVAAPLKDGLFSFGSENYPSRLYLYKNGIRVDTVEHDFPVAVDAHLEASDFSTNATYSGIITNPVFDAAVATARAHCDDLVQKAAAEQTERAARDLRGYLSIHGLGTKKIPAWLRLLGRSPLASEQKRDEIESLRREARVAAWLRHTASSILSSPERDATSQSRTALWDCPLYVSATGRPLSLSQLNRQFKRIGFIPVTDPGSVYPDAWVFRFEPFLHVVWVLDKNDTCLVNLFENNLSEWGAVRASWDIARLPFRKMFKDKDYYDTQATEAPVEEGP